MCELGFARGDLDVMTLAGFPGEPMPDSVRNTLFVIFDEWVKAQGG